MENKKFEQLIDLIINEQEDKAKELFHEIVVEKSREIYESIMDEEMMDEEGEMVGEVGDLMDEISAEESGDVVEAEDEADIEFDDEAEEAGDDLTGDLEADHDAEGSVDKEDLGDIKDKLDDLMAEFESLMGGDDMGDDDMGDDMGDDDMGDEDDMSEEMMEAVQLQKVSVTHGDDGAQKKSPVAANAGAKGMDSKPVKFSGSSESVPNGPKGPSNEYSKKEGDLPGAGSFKNVPGGKAKVDLSAAPKPVTKDGSAGGKSPVAKG
jgi:hypothetical protein